MKIKRIAIAVTCLTLAFTPDISLAHGHNGNCHNNYNYDYDYDYDYGCHYGHNNCINNNYDCSNYPDHAHPDGVCPYYCPDASYQYYQAATVKKVQVKLNKSGYKCGKANGIYNTKTKKAIKKFQKKKNLSVNGKINKTLLKKLNL
ncbi:MAG: hypothetical protein HFH68_07325 [Lachnospiraceae bacterium]|nr:hypothetical protein [Lachnospiraceae bacterium]